MQTLLTAIVTWLSANFGMPASYDYPRIELVPAAEMEAVRLRGQGSGESPGTSQPAPRGGGRDIEGLYDDASRTIYLPKGWTGATPAERSVLVHEMVHHLQNVAGLKYECPEAREELAYSAQDRWLARSGRNIMKEFKLNKMTLLVRTRCMY